jgi:nitronate monooxygenase
MKLKPLVIKGKEIRIPIFQGGMGIGASLSDLSSSVSSEGGAGVLSSAGLHIVGISRNLRHQVDPYRAAYDEVLYSKVRGKFNDKDGFICMNIMTAITRDYEQSVRGSLDAGVDAIISGAGLPLSLPSIQSPKDTALIPIVSSVRTLDIICKRWARFKYRPDAVIVEGPLAGGHLGFKLDDIANRDFQLKEIFLPIKEYAQKNGDFPVIVAGGVYNYLDILFWQAFGADGVQMGTRFLATEECSASKAYKDAVVACHENDIGIVDPKVNPPGSPCGLPFRILKNSPVLLKGIFRKPKCNRGFVAQKDSNGNFTVCPASHDCQNYFCICNSLLASAGFADDELPVWTVGANAYRVKKILSVHSLMNKLKGLEEDNE